MRNVSEINCRENQEKLYSVTLPENRANYEMWKNIVEPDRAQMTIWYMRAG